MIRLPRIDPVGILQPAPGFEQRPRRYSRLQRALAAALLLVFLLAIAVTTIAGLGSYCLTTDAGDMRPLTRDRRPPSAPSGGRRARRAIAAPAIVDVPNPTGGGVYAKEGEDDHEGTAALAAAIGGAGQAVAEVGALRLASAPGGRCARTTAPTATPGTSSRTTSPAARRTAGARTASPASATATSSSSSPSRFWNGRDPILKERLFGLVPSEGNHGEDVKEYYFYLDNTPTHSYMKYPLQVPAGGVSPTAGSIEENRRRRAAQGPSSSCSTPASSTTTATSTSSIEYAKADAEDICIRIEAFNRGPEAAPLHILPHLWFRNTWAWGAEPRPEPTISLGPRAAEASSAWSPTIRTPRPLRHLPFEYQLGPRYLYAPPAAQPLFTDNETNADASSGPGRRAAARTSRTPSTATSSTARTASTRAESAPRPASTTRLERPAPAARSSSACGSPTRR